MSTAHADLDAAVTDEGEFTELVERHRRELQVHCYRMVGSFDDAEDLVQETLLRAWRKRESNNGRATFRAWLYRIATNACLDFLDRAPASRQAASAPAGGEGGGTNAAVTPPPVVAVPWLQPYPDELLETRPSDDADVDVVVEARETVELAFLAALQYLPPRQRAALIARDVLGWPSAETAELLDMTVPSVNSALQRARAELRRNLPESRASWRQPAPTAEERAALAQYRQASERADVEALAAMLREDARFGQMPGASGNYSDESVWEVGRDQIMASWAPALEGAHAADFQVELVSGNRQPGMAVYARLRDEPDAPYEAFGLDLLRIEDGVVAEYASFPPEVFPRFGLPMTK
jgi:RNA polymerase sigma-70 factor, ECF subfamily